MSSEELETASNGISRRTIAKGVAWATPAVAAVAAAPMAAASPVTTTTTRPPCVDDVSATGGTYPVTVSLSNCSTANSHWDFNFKITAATQNCDCTHLRVTFFDNPNRSRLWISNGFGSLPALSPGSDNPQSRTQHDPRLYVQKILTPGQTATFPEVGDAVRRVGGGAPHSGFEIDSGTAAVGTITAHGTADDSLHALINPTGGALPCSATGPMAYYRVDCRTSPTGAWTQLGGIGTINECVPMIQSTVCVYDTTGNDRYRLGVSLLTSCGIPASNFVVTRVQRNSDTNFPNEGTSVWTGSQALSAGVTNILTTTAGSGTQLWISFTTDGGVNTSQIRVPTNTTTCTPLVTSATNNQTTCPTGNRTINVQWTGTSTKLQYRIADASGNFSGDWSNQDDTASPGTISLSVAATKCRAVQVRLCNGGTGQTCTQASPIVVVPAVGTQALMSQQQSTTESLESGTTESGTTESGTTESGTTESGTTESGTTEGGTTEGSTTEGSTTEGSTTESSTTDE